MPRLLLLALGLLALAWPSLPAARPSPGSPWPPGAEGLRWLEADLDAAPLPEARGRLRLAYDPAPHLAPADPARLDGEALAVRLVLSELGPERLLDSEGGLREALALLYTVFNRLDPAIANPLGLPRLRPYPGCGPGMGFADCANPRQYLALATRRARHPTARLPPARALTAVDLAVLAWRLARGHEAADPGRGATQLVHRCGGRAEGQPTTACDEPAERQAGADPHTGPLVLRAPDRPSPAGHYRLAESARIPYAPRASGEDRAWLRVLAPGR